MHNYELMFIVRPDVDEETLKSTRDRIQSVITEHGGEITDVQDMGRRRLAYMIQKFREGIYTVYNFKANAAVVNELNHTLNINDNVIRHMIINIDDK